MGDARAGPAAGFFIGISCGLHRDFIKRCHSLLMPIKKILRILIATVLILLVPFVAMQFTGEVSWSVLDFVAAGVLLSGTGFAYEWLASRAVTTWHKLAVGLAVGTALLLVWLNLAVGIIGAENNPANLMYLGVLAVGIIGAIFGRFEARGMVRALLATAAAHAVVAVVTLVAGFSVGSGVIQTLVLDSFFVLLWVAAGLLFRNASEPLRAE